MPDVEVRARDECDDPKARVVEAWLNRNFGALIRAAMVKAVRDSFDEDMQSCAVLWPPLRDRREA